MPDGVSLISHSPLILTAGSLWQSSVIPCMPFSWQELELTLSTPARCLWSAQFLANDHDPVLAADCYSSVDAHTDGRHSAVFRGREGASSARITLANPAGPLRVDDVKVRRVSPERAREICLANTGDWIHRKAETVGCGHAVLQRAAQRAAGRPLRLVLLGDSIINDLNNSNFDLFLPCPAPATEIQIIPSVRGATGCWYFQEPGPFASFVTNCRPDLLLVGGVSQREDIEAIRAVLQRARRELGCELLLLSGALRHDCRATTAPTTDGPPEDERPWLIRLEALAREENVAYFDLCTAWHRTLNASGKPIAWFHRDDVHANDRGKQILGRLLVEALT